MNKALFLDRDGIINIDHGYVSTPNDFEFCEGIFSLCKRFEAEGFLIIVVTNQSGIGRGYYSTEAFLQLNKWMVNQFSIQGVNIRDTFYCPHHPQKAQGEYLKDCDSRKPNTGMFERAKEKYAIDMSASVMIGDRMSDMQASEAASVGHRYLLSNNLHQADNSASYQRIDSLQGAADLFFESR